MFFFGHGGVKPAVFLPDNGKIKNQNLGGTTCASNLVPLFPNSLLAYGFHRLSNDGACYPHPGHRIGAGRASSLNFLSEISRNHIADFILGIAVTSNKAIFRR